MPTQHVGSEAHELLQDVGTALLKARKVVVVTGAGISTNSGIPDFRSENGLYSLIQAQFDAVIQQTRQSEKVKSDSVNDSGEEDEPRKRRRILRGGSPQTDTASQEERDDVLMDSNSMCAEPDLPVHGNTPDNKEAESRSDGDALERPYVTTPQSKLLQSSDAQPSTSPLSSPPAEDFLLPPFSLRSEAHKHLTDVSHTITSSPLSSPPPVLFDPFQPSSPSDINISRRSSTTPSEVDESQAFLNAFSASQTSNSGKNSLPNMKGKDLFDASIWADPRRTSVFYQFATSLRQKVRDAEPTGSHKFISHLRDRGKLVRCYTQNIDQIEEKVGLSTALQDGPGSRGRFSRRSTANTAQLSKMVEEVSGGDSGEAIPTDESNQSSTESSQQSQPSKASQETKEPSNKPNVKSEEDDAPQPEQAKPQPPKREPPRSGVECVFLHGSLELLRCFLCGRVCSWDDDDRVMETLSGQQPECPHCVGATEARKEKGKRALGVGKLRPDIVLYGEEHPNAHLISPIVTHDLGLYPDMLLILGTSLRVHGLKILVREFAKAVHSKGGKVVFVNFTKPPESSWGDIIDYWIQWDCDAWVADLQIRIPKMWQAPEPPKPKKKRDSSGTSEDGKEEKKKKPPAANPVALRDTKVSGAYCTLKILKELHRIAGVAAPPARRASSGTTRLVALPGDSTIQAGIDPIQKMKAKPKRPRKSAPGALEKTKRTPSTLNPNHGRRKKPASDVDSNALSSEPPNAKEDFSSILHSVKSNPRKRKRKVIDGVEVDFPTVGKNRAGSESLYKSPAAELKLPPLRPESEREPASPFGKPEPMEPKSPPAGPPNAPPLASLSVNMRAAITFERPETFYIYDPLIKYLETPPEGRRAEIPRPITKQNKHRVPRRTQTHQGTKAEAEAEANAALALAGLRAGSPVVSRTARLMPSGFEESELMNWGATWNCRK